jgi:hypothetical protein
MSVLDWQECNFVLFKLVKRIALEVHEMCHFVNLGKLGEAELLVQLQFFYYFFLRN